MRLASRLSLVLGTVLLLAAATRPAAAQCVSLTTLGSAYTQSFDTLSNVAGSTTNNLTITGWFMTEGGGGARDNEQYAVDTGGSTTGDTYSYGAAGSTERALGQLRSGTLIPLFGACFTNNTGSTVTSLAVAYNGEQWRLGTAGRTDQMSFEYSTNATDLVTGTWTNVAALNFVTPDTATTGAKNGNAAGDRTALSSTVSALSIPNGATFWIRWNDADASGADDGLAVDDFSLTPNAVPPVNLSINDVSLNEGNAGTTSFTFTVSLSAPAGPGGVTFDVATANGTAVQPGDYTQKSLTGQTIPAGSSTYSFTVLVNGDTTPETNETFFVNVTNVTGATVTDGQGQGTIVNDDVAPNLTVNDVSLNEGNAGTTTFTFTVSLSAPAPGGGVTFDIATANGTATAPSDYTARSLTSQTIPAGSSTYTFDVLVNGDITPESDETFLVNVTNATNAIVTDGQGQGTIVNDDLSKIHDVQGNTAATPIPGATVMVEGVVTAGFQGPLQLRGFFLQEEDADVDADPQTSEGIFVFCSSCPTPVAEGQRVKVTGSVSEFNNMTQITATTAGSVVVTDAGNHLAEVTPAPVDLPVGGDVNAFYETLEGMLVTFVDTLTVSEYFELARYGQILLYEGGRPFQFTETSPPNMAGFAAHNDNLSRREVILDDDNNAQEWYLPSSTPPGPPDGSQFVFHPRANGGFSVGTQGTDFFRGGDLVNGLTGVLHWSFPGFGADTWRIRPTAAHPVAFTVANPRPATPPAVGGAIKAVSMNLLNYFTTVDTTSGNTGPCGPSGGLDCRGADSVAELNRQRERASVVVCGLNADVYAFMELENTTPSDTITDLLGAVNARCGGAHPYDFVNTGGTLGTDAIRVQLIYRTGIVSPVGSPLVDLDPVHSRPPTAQTFDVVDAANPAFGERFTVIANHLKSKGSCPSSGPDADAGDGQGCFNATRVAQSNRLLTWINGTVLPAAGDPDVLLLGDFNSYAKEDPVTALVGGGYTDLESAILGPSAYSYLFDGQLGHLDYAFASASLAPQVTGIGAWHINADEAPLFDYNDEVKDAGEAPFEEKPDGSALVPPRVVFQPASPFRASDHDPVLVGLFQIAGVSITKAESADPVTAGTSFSYTITVNNTGPDPAAGVEWTDTLPAGTTFVSLSQPGGWTCTDPGVGAGGTVTCSLASLAVGSAAFTLTVHVNPSVAAGSVLSNQADVTTTTADDDSDNSATETTTVAASADLSVTKVDDPDPVSIGMVPFGTRLTYTITVTNGGPSNAASVSFSDTLPAGTTFEFLSSPGWTCATPDAGAPGTVSCSTPSFAPGTATFALLVRVDNSLADGTVLSNTVTVTSPTADPSPGSESATATTQVASVDMGLSLTKSDAPDPVLAGGNITYTITAANTSSKSIDAAGIVDFMPPGTTFVSMTAPAGWTCSTPPVGGTGSIGCNTSPWPQGSVTFSLVLQVASSVPGGTMLKNESHLNVLDGDNNFLRIATTTTTVASPPAVSGTKTVSGTFQPGGSVTYTVVLTNTGGVAQADNPGAEFTDVLPAGLTLVSASATSGTAVATVATRTVTWNGSLAAGASVTITINATIDSGIAAGTTLANQGTIAFDADGNGTNEASAPTDDPGASGTGNSTAFVVTAAPAVAEIPTLDEIGLALLAMLLAMGGAVMLRRRRA